MKLNINFMIKDGKRIVSRSTVGYKVLLNRVQKEFNKINHLPAKEIDVTVIIQMSKKAAENHSGKNYAVCGTFMILERTIVMYYHNAFSKEKHLAFLAHEFGHLHHNINDYHDFSMQSVNVKERYADKFAKKITGINPESITGKVRSIAAMRRNR